MVQEEKIWQPTQHVHGNKQLKRTTITENKWKASEASVSGHQNTPPLREDLIPRSRMAPGRNLRVRGKTKLLLGQMSDTTNLERLNKLKEGIQGR